MSAEGAGAARTCRTQPALGGGPAAQGGQETRGEGAHHEGRRPGEAAPPRGEEHKEGEEEGRTQGQDAQGQGHVRDVEVTQHTSHGIRLLSSRLFALDFEMHCLFSF